MKNDVKVLGMVVISERYHRFYVIVAYNFVLSVLP